MAHEINGVLVQLTKASCEHWVHMTNLPDSISAETLAHEFGFIWWKILIKPGNFLLRSQQERKTEAWFKHIYDEPLARHLARTWSSIDIDNETVFCTTVRSSINPAELCFKNQNGLCQRLDEECDFKHEHCGLNFNCDDHECWLGHSSERNYCTRDDSNTSE